MVVTRDSHKKCTRCKEVKSIEEFTTRSGKRGIVARPECKACHSRINCTNTRRRILMLAILKEEHPIIYRRLMKQVEPILKEEGYL